MEGRRIGPELKSLMNCIARFAAKNWSDPLTGMTEMHAEILHYLMEARDQVIVQKDLEQVFTIRKSTVSRMLHLIEQRGMIERLSIEGDARQKRIIPTEKAYAMKERMHKGAAEFETSMIKGISDEELEVFFRVIEKIKANISENS